MPLGYAIICLSDTYEKIENFERQVYIMIPYFTGSHSSLLTVISIFITFAATFLIIKGLEKVLPRDQGREFAVNGAKSQGKPRGAGLLFILTFSACALLFIPFSPELLIYIVLVIIEMLSGYFDDRATTPWGEWKKGLIDLFVAVSCAVTYIYYNGTTIHLLLNGSMDVTIPPVLFVILAVILIWTSINVTNCADGVDGLSGSLSIVTLFTLYGISQINGVLSENNHMILLFCVTLIAYLWFNASPSRLLMGDAGSRAIGFFIALAALKTGSPLLYIPAAFILLMDGGLGLVKVFLLRTVKIKILTNTRTPIHDHVRKNIGWSDTQVVIRFVILQLMISLLVIFFA